MLWESSKVEQRYDAVMGVIREGFSITEVAQKFGVSRQSVYTWMQRYKEGGFDAQGSLVAPGDVAGADRGHHRSASWSCVVTTPVGARCTCAINSRRKGYSVALGVFGLSSLGAQRSD